MKVTQEVLPDSQVGLEIEVPADLSQKTYDQVLRKSMRTVNIPGFRKGKVPKQVFLQRVGRTQFNAAVLEELVQTAVETAIKQEKIDALGTPQLKSSFEELVGTYEPGQPITIAAAVDVPPRVTLKQYEGLTVEAEEVTYDSQRVDDTLEQYRANLATLVPIEDRPAAMGDVAVADFVGKIKTESGDLEPFEGGEANDFQVELAEGRFIPGFVEGMVGMTLDETKELDLTFPEDYPQEDLAGQQVVFTITLKELKEKDLPDLDDDFAEEVSEFDTLAELRTSLERNYQEEAEEKTKGNRNAALLNALLEHLEAEIPNTLIQKEVDYLLNQTLMRLANQGIDINKILTRELVQDMRERSRPEAVDRLRRTLALGEVAKQVGIEVDEAQVTARIDEVMADVKDPSKIDAERLNEVIREETLQETILGWLAENNTVVLVPPKDDDEQAEDAQTPVDEPAAASATVDAESVAVVSDEEDSADS